jgi:hypothetical protein
MQGQAHESALGCRISIRHIVIVETGEWPEIQQYAVTFISRMDFPDTIPMCFCNPEGIIGPVSDLPGIAESFVMRRDIIKGIERIYLEKLAVIGNDLAISDERQYKA